ncbi:MAG: hypothetical protein IKN71_07985 [Alphaproteobacteria bacterium]|nr:hypothetical protein [Alphaproteobacteria bacterium]
MTDEELAKHWNISLEEVKSISEFMNKNYSLHVGKDRKTGLYYGLIYRNDPKHGPMLAVSSKQGYRTSRDAADFLNSACDIMQMPEERAKMMKVPVDAYKVLKKIDFRPTVAKTNALKPNSGRDPRD